jgi:hypothetical protein
VNRSAANPAYDHREGDDAGSPLRTPEEYLTMAKASHLLPGRPHISTLHRWRLRGVRGVRLQTCLVGGRRYTTSEWLAEFIEASSLAVAPETPVQISSRREADIRAAELELDDAGI